ncbi:MAG: thiamine pyrophosphate-dependent enzyme [Paracoccaceae bacterium]|nr:thiamine pyrophosphate-dependent enzyme [Paracoccaceae bacterium]
MPKSIQVDPKETRASGRLSFPDVPIHAYSRTVAEERVLRGAETLCDVLRHMMILRAFETGIASLKSTGRFGDLEYAYKGPAHLSIGQEAAAVGAALALTAQDHVFGSHRSHSEFLAKGLRAIQTLSEPDLQAIMERHEGGTLLRAVAAHLPGRSVRQTAEHFLLLGFLAEIFMRANGFNGGMGGSMHAFFLPFGAYPNNAIVGASAGIATGAALQMKAEGRAAITVSMVGDGATGCGPVWEAMNFAGMAQFDRLWQAEGGLPVLFFFTNNFYAMGGQTQGETMAWDRLSRIGAGLRADAYHAETVDGTNAFAVADAVARKRALLVDGQGPALLDVECYRFSGHSTTDVNAYRTKEEIAAWQTVDPIASLQGELDQAGVLQDAEAASMQDGIEHLMHRVFQAAADPEVSPPVDVTNALTLIGDKMFSHRETPPAAPAPDPMVAPETVARVRQLAKRSRAGFDEDGNVLSPMKAITLRDGLFEAVLHHMQSDSRVMLYGEECREWGGAFGVYRGLSELYLHDRVFNAPISEAAIVATAIGAAMEGGRPVVELMYADFIGRAGDEIFNQLSKWQAMSNGALSVPVVLRCSVGSKYGAQHSQDWSALAAHIPGLKIVYPATPYDAKGLMSAAIASDDPVLMFESQRLYDKVELFQDVVPAGDYHVPMGAPDVKRAGDDATVLTIGPSLYPALEAADALAERGVSLEVIDARSLVPFDYSQVLTSVAKTGRVLIVSEASERGSFPMTLASNITRFAFADLKAPPRVLGSPNWIVPGADMEDSYFPQATDIEDAVLIDLMGEAGHNRKGLRTWDDIELAARGL